LAKKDKVADDWTAGANEFQMKDAATENERRPTVCQNVQQLGRTSANGGDQEGTTGPRMTVPDHVVHETPSQRRRSQPVRVDATSERLREHLQRGRSNKAGTPDEPQRWAQTEGVAAGKLAARTTSLSYHIIIINTVQPTNQPNLLFQKQLHNTGRDKETVTDCLKMHVNKTHHNLSPF